MEKEYRKISKLSVWGRNPRSITKANFNHLKELLRKYGQFKPIIINKADLIVGGNMRFRAMTEIRKGKTGEDKDYLDKNPHAFEDIWVSVVDAPTEAKKLEYSLVDNESVGKWEEEELAELLIDNWADMEMTDYKIDVKKINLEKLLEKFGPEEKGGTEPLILEDKVKCPKCGFIFSPEDDES